MFRSRPQSSRPHSRQAARPGPFRPRLEVLEGRLAPATFSVSTAADSGPGSLRQAILDSNGTAGPNLIRFDFTGDGVHTIQPTSALPRVTAPVTIDGTTQAGYAGQPLIELNGSSAPGNVDGLQITAGNCTVKGLVINGWHLYGIELDGSGGDVITDNYIGTDAAGDAALGNTSGGVYVASSNNTIGGPGHGNVIAGNGDQIFISEVNTPGGNVVQGNTIGTDVTGSVALGNGSGGGNGDGVIVFQGAHDTLIGGQGPGEGNLISGNHRIGVNMSVGGSGNVVQGNTVGTDVTGSVALGNGLWGVYVASTPGANVSYNLISGNADIGLYVVGFASTGTVVHGNAIGTDATGTFALGNGGDGVRIDGGTGNTVGGTGPTDGNLISGNAGNGVTVLANNDRVQGNLIGTDVTGSAALGNGGDGVSVNGSGNLVGGTDAGAGNTIAFNGLDGVLVSGGSGNAIRGNSIFSHPNGLGIRLANGANNNAAAPALTSATSDGATTTVQGTLTGTANTTFVIEFFANTDCNPSGFGEGETPLGTITVSTDGSGQASFTAVFDTAVPPGEFITATATDPANNTSAFSNCAAVTG
jgi:hypothetical protein